MYGFKFQDNCLMILYHLMFFCKLYNAKSVMKSALMNDDYLIYRILGMILIEIMFKILDTKLRIIFVTEVSKKYNHQLGNMIRKPLPDLINIGLKDLMLLPDTIHLSENMMECIIIDLPKIFIYQIYYGYQIWQFSNLFLLTIIGITGIIIPIICNMYRRITDHKKKLTEYEAIIKKYIMNQIDSLKTIKMADEIDNEIERTNLAYHNRIYENTKMIRSSGLYQIIRDISIITLRGVILYFGIESYTTNKYDSIVEIVYLATNCTGFISHSFDLVEMFYQKRVYDISTIKMTHLGNIKDEYEPKDFYRKLPNIDYYDVLAMMIDNRRLEMVRNKLNIITGRNGIGKTLIMDSLLGLNKINSIHFYLKNSYTQSSIPIDTLIEPEFRMLFSYVPQKISLLDRRIYDNLCLGSDDKQIEYLNKIYDCKEWYDSIIDKNVSDLSGGEARKLGILNSLYQDRPIVIFDEPTNDLDVEAVNKFISILQVMHSYKKMLIIVTHDDKLIKMKNVSVNYL